MLNLLNLRSALRQRLNGVLAAVAGSLACCVCGLLMTFVFAPGQALEAARTARLPEMGPAEVRAAAPGDDIIITGRLAGEPPPDGPNLLAYTVEEWIVTLPSSDSEISDPSGRWQSEGAVVPDLSLEVAGEAIAIAAADNARLTGDLREEIIAAENAAAAPYEGEWLPQGTRRYRGLAAGDLVTVLGDKNASGAVSPRHLFAGDRAAFQADQRQAASALMFSGITAIVLAPVVLVGGVIAALVTRRS